MNHFSENVNVETNRALVYFRLPNKIVSLKNRKLFLKKENKRKEQLSNVLLLFIRNFLLHIKPIMCSRGMGARWAKCL